MDGSTNDSEEETTSARKSPVPSDTSPNASARKSPEPSDTSPNAHPSSNGSASAGVPIDPRQVLSKKIAQLTKVVVHLNARNDENEGRFKKMRESFETDIRTIMSDAHLKIGQYQRQLDAFLDPAPCESDIVRTRVLEHEQERKVVLEQLAALKAQGEKRDVELRERNAVRTTELTSQVRELAKSFARKKESFHNAVGKTQSELEQQSSELRRRHELELAAVRAEYDRRIADLQAAQDKEIAHLDGAREQAVSHLMKLQESEFEVLRLRSEQKRKQGVQRAEQDFEEERKTLEQQLAQYHFELEQHEREAEDATQQVQSTKEQIEAMRTALEEMSKRVAVCQEDCTRADREREVKEAEARSCRERIALLQANRKEKLNGMVAPPPPEAPSVGKNLADELRRSLLEVKNLESELEDQDGAVAEAEEELTEKEKELELMEIELEEEQLRTKQLQERLIDLECVD